MHSFICRMKKAIPLFLFLVITLLGVGQETLTRAEYIEKYKDLAIEDMRIYGIPASITMAQALLESSNGNSDLARKSNNHFGIKCHSTWEGKKTYHDDDKKGECFRVYPSVRDSYRDHSEFLLRPRYAACFELKVTDYKGWAKELKNAGYATNPKYPDLLIRIIEDNNLHELDSAPKPRQAGQPPVLSSGEDGEDFEDLSWNQAKQVYYAENKVKYVLAQEGDTPEDVARRMFKGRWEITRYNEVPKDHVFKSGDIVYIQPKKKRGTESTYVVKDGDTVWSIAQEFGIKTKHLRKKNAIAKDGQVPVGDTLYLRSKKPL